MFSEMFQGAVDKMKEVLLEDLKELSGEVAELLGDLDDLYRALDIENRVLEALSSFDKTPMNHQDLTLIPLIPSSWEKKVVRMAVKRLYMLAAVQLRDALKSASEKKAPAKKTPAKKK